MKILFASTWLLLAASAAAAPVQIASLSSVLTDIAKNVGGNRVEIVSIVKPGVDPHVFEPTPGDVRKISQAQLVLASGLGFEGYLEKLRSGVGTGPVFVVAGDVIAPLALAEEHDHDHDHDHGDHGVDPHWWHSIKNVQTVSRQIRDALIAVDPEGRSAYEANTKAYQKQLDELARWVRLEIAKLPKNRRTLVTSHDALGYFARDYAFEILPVQGISTTDQPSSRKVKSLIEEIRRRNVKAIFAENIENPRVLEQITQETGARLGGTLYADGLGTGQAGTYEGMMRHNVAAIVGALQ